MTPIAAILDEARARHGDDLDGRMPTPVSGAALAAIPDDRWLAGMARRVFSAGFVWRVIEAKWDGFEAAFQGFDPDEVAHLDEQGIAELAGDVRIVRNRQKIVATVHNAGFVGEIAAEHGSFGAWVAAWPGSDIVGLWDALSTRGKRLGGDTGPRLLRMMGKDTFILTGDVCHALDRFAGIQGRPAGKRYRREAQAAFSAWSEASGLGLGALSMVLASSGDAPRT
jgi:3-methyladenine DNA glycosylase Tag